MSALPGDGPLPSGVPAEGMVWLPMEKPLDREACPCGKAPVDGFCEEHTGAVAFKIPVTADGDVLPAVDWHWAHGQPCPLGESWLIGGPTDVDPTSRSRVWAGPHREHRLNR